MQQMARGCGEEQWRSCAPPHILDGPSAGVCFARWQSDARAIVDVNALPNPDHQIVEIVLRRTSMRLQIGDQLAFDGVAMPGLTHLTPPGRRAQGRYRGPFDS